MKRALVQPLVQAAYTLHSAPSDASLTEKSAQFAGFVAHQATSAHMPANRADTFGQIAAENMLALVHESYQYSMTRAQKTFALQQAKAALDKARTPWAHRTSTELKTVLNSMPLSAESEAHFKSTCLKQNTALLEAAKTSYPRAFCIAFLAFQDAAETSTQKQFEKILHKELMQKLADPFSYGEFFLQCLSSTEMSVIMGIVLCLGLIILALPSLQLSALAASTTYAIGASMTLVGSAFHLWRACSPPPPPEDVQLDELPLAATL
jgi:hypothetical protein